MVSVSVSNKSASWDSVLLDAVSEILQVKKVVEYSCVWNHGEIYEIWGEVCGLITILENASICGICFSFDIVVLLTFANNE